MARLGVTYHDIANAANQLAAENKQPTIEQIRHLLGTGSATTIANHLRKWRAEQDGSMVMAQKENLPQELVSIMKDLWQRVQTHADQQISSHQQESEQTLHKLQQEVDKYKTNNQRWQKMHEMWMKEKDELSRDRVGMQEAMIALQKDTVALAAKSEAETKRIEELQRLHKLAQENLEHYRESMRVQRLIDQEKHAQQLQQAEADLKKAEKQLVMANQEKLSLQNKYNDAIHQSDKLQVDFKALQNEWGELKSEVSHLTKRYDVLQKKFDEQHLMLVDNQKHNAVISQQLTATSDEVKELKEQNKLLTQEKWEIAQERAQMEGVNQQMEKMLRAKEVLS
jgi:chromosome segregation ATPase